MSLDEIRQGNRIRHIKARAATQPAIASLGNRSGDRYSLAYTDGGIGYGEKLFNGVNVEGDRLLGIENNLGRVSVLGQNATDSEPEIIASPLKGASQVDRSDWDSGRRAPALRNRQGYLRGQIFADPEERAIVWEYQAVSGRWNQQSVSRPFVGGDPDSPLAVFGAVALGILDLPSPATIRISLAGRMTASRIGEAGFNNTFDAFDIRLLRNRSFAGRRIERIIDFYPVVIRSYEPPYLVANVAESLTQLLGNRGNDPSVGTKIYAAASPFLPTLPAFFEEGYLDNVPASDANPIVSASGFTSQRLSFTTQVRIPSGKHAITVSAYCPDTRFIDSAFYNAQVRLTQ